jgi:hypothetical protein
VAAPHVAPRDGRCTLGEDWRIAGVRNELIGYFPDHSATLRSRLRLLQNSRDRSRLWNIYGKVRYDDSGEEVFASMAALFDSEASREGIVGYAPARSQAIPAERVLWQKASMRQRSIASSWPAASTAPSGRESLGQWRVCTVRRSRWRRR